MAKCLDPKVDMTFKKIFSNHPDLLISLLNSLLQPSDDRQIESGAMKYYNIFTDNLGSILSVVDEAGNKVFDVTYSAWGRQEVTTNLIGIRCGYCGHEMLNEFQLINMNQRSLSRSGESNARLYDSVLGRFLSPDPYIQNSDMSQNFNRYSYLQIVSVLLIYGGCEVPKY